MAMTEEMGGVPVPVVGEPARVLWDPTENFVPKPFPTRIDFWRVVIQVPEPPEMLGSLYLPEEYRDRKEFASYVGYVLDIGPLAFRAVTRSGLRFDETHKFEVGDWVHFSKHAGEKFRTADGTLYVVCSESEVFGVCDHPEQFECLSM